MENNKLKGILKGIEKFKNEYKMDDNSFQTFILKCSYYNYTYESIDISKISELKNDKYVKKFCNNYSNYQNANNENVVYNSLVFLFKAVTHFDNHDNASGYLDFKFSDPEGRNNTFKGPININDSTETNYKLNDDTKPCNNINKSSISNVRINRKNINRLNKVLLSGYSAKSSNTQYSNEYVAIASDTGKLRKHNEDASLFISHHNNDDFKLVAIADGMGGHSAGDIFSHDTLEELSNWFDSLSLDYYYNIDALADSLKDKILEINNNFRRNYSQEGGTTLALAITCSKFTLFVNIGDSRIYGYSDWDQELDLLSEDETPAWEGKEYTDSQRFKENSNQITNCLCSFDDVKVSQIFCASRGTFDKIILCSDGVTDLLSYRDMYRIISRNSNNSEIANGLVNKAVSEPAFRDLNYGSGVAQIPAGKDNATCLVLSDKAISTKTLVRSY